MEMTQDIITDNILKAMDTIVDKKLSEADYDKTIEATIVDNSNADKGIYTIFYGTAQWEAYTKDTSFQIGDIVQVLIPGNDTRKTKTIIGKVSSKDDAISINQPFDNFIDVTGNLIDTIIQNNTKLLANGDITKKILWEYVGDIKLTDYKTIGLEANFESIISKAVEGEYGLVLELTGESSSTEYLELYLNTKDMIGNPYDFSTSVKHQKLFDISKYNFTKITKISLYFYQERNFKDIEGNYINSKDSFGNALNPNLFISSNSLKLMFGFMYDQIVWGQDIVDINVAPGFNTNYNLDIQQSVVNLTWLHWDDNKTRIIPKQEIIDTIDYKIEWYYFRLENYVLKDIEEQYQNKEGKFKNLSDEEADLLKFNLESNIGCSYIKNKNWQRLTDFDNLFSCKVNFINANSENEYKLRAFVFKNKEDNNPLASKILTFENTSKTNQTKDEQKIGVEIVALDGSFGNYYCYTGTGILNNEDTITRVLQVNFYDIDGNLIENLETDEDSLVYYDDPIWEFPKANTMLKSFKKGTSRTQYIYTISNIYDISKTNNTVSCTIKERGIDGSVTEYYGTFDFNFGQSGNIYGNNTLVIDYLNLLASDKNIIYTRNAIKQGDKKASYIIRMFDCTNSEIDLMSDIGCDIIWELKIYDATNEGKYLGSVKIDNNFENISLNSYGQQVDIFWAENSAGADIENKLYILQASIKDNNNKESIIQYPIAISKDLELYNHIRGCTSVVYRAIGNPIKYNDEYLLYDYKNLNDPYKNVSWSLIGDQGVNAQIKFKNNRIEVNGAYFKTTEEPNCFGVRCINDQNEILWQQPIVILKSEFESTTVNNWDGHSVDINEGTVAAVMMATGKKNDKGEFTGILMGDIEKDTGEIGITTGVYGFNEGNSVYALQDNGKAFFGAAGNGRILIDGNNSTLTSSRYIDNETGLFLDLDDAYLNFKNNNYYIDLDASDDNLDVSKSSALKIGTGSEPNFSVNWNGDLRANNAWFRGQIANDNFKVTSDGNAYIKGEIIADKIIANTEGQIGGWNIDSDSLSNGNMDISSSTGINFNNVFTVDSSGNLKATEAIIEGSVTAEYLKANTSGEIAGWIISKEGLTNGIFELKNSLIQFGDNFKVSDDGQLDVTDLNVLGTLQINAAENGRINNFIKIQKISTKNYSIGKNKYKKDLTIKSVNIENGYVPIAITRITTGSSYVRPFHFGIKYSYGDNVAGGTVDIVIKVSKYPRKKKIQNRKLNVWILLIKGSGPQLADLTDSDDEIDIDQAEIEDFDSSDSEIDPSDGNDIVGSSGISVVKINSGGKKSDSIVLTRGSAYNNLYYDPSYTLNWLETTVFNNGVEEGESHFDPGTTGYNQIYKAGQNSVYTYWSEYQDALAQIRDLEAKLAAAQSTNNSGGN